MKRIHNMLVCLDLTDIDPFLIKYAAFMAGIFEAERVLFIHAIQAYDLPDKRKKSFEEVKASLDRKIREELDQLVDLRFRRDYGIEVITRIEEEDAAEGVISFVEEDGIDLVMIGQKPGADRKGLYGKKIAAHTASDILFVPEYTEPEIITRALCAVDFSEVSEAAFEIAVRLFKKHRVHVLCYAVQDPSTAYFPATTRKSAGKKQSGLEQGYQKFLEKWDLKAEDFPCRIEAADSLLSEPERLYGFAEEKEVQLVIIGAKGETETETSLLGNITETLRRMQTHIPIMIVKGGRKKGFLNYFGSGDP
ncbi:MAG: universal stress protein [Desulfobacterales bacterium]